MLRIVRGQWQRRLIMGSMILFICYTSALILISVFGCGLPIANHFSQKCLAVQRILEPLNYAAATFNAVMDWILTATPIFAISKLQMPKRAKLSACLLLGLCALGSIVSVVRIAYAAGGSPGASFFAKDVPFMVLSLCETGLGMIAISFAALRPLLLIVWEKARTVVRTGQELEGLNTGNKLDKAGNVFGIMEMGEVHELRTSKSPRCDSFDEEINVWSNITENKRSSYIDTRKTYIDYPSDIYGVRHFVVDTPMGVSGTHKSYVASPAGVSIDGKSYMDFPSPVSGKSASSTIRSIPQNGLSMNGISFVDSSSINSSSPTSAKYPPSSYNAIPSPMSERPISFIPLPSPGASERRPSYLPLPSPAASERRPSNLPVPTPAHVSRPLRMLPNLDLEANWASEVASSIQITVPAIQPAPASRPRANRSHSSSRMSLYRRSNYTGTSRQSQVRQSLYRHSQCPYDLYQLGNSAGEVVPDVPDIPGGGRFETS